MLIEGLVFATLNIEMARSLELPFGEEVFAALKELNRDKALNPDGFTLLFGKILGALLKVT